MKEGKDNVKPKGDIAEAAPKAISVAVSRIHNEDEAVSWCKTQEYMTKYSGEVLVTEDRNIFLKPNENQALNHASKQGLKLFRIQWPV